MTTADRTSGRATPPVAGSGPPAPTAPSAPASPREPMSVGGSILRHPFLVLLPMIVLVGAAIALASQRAPTYTAEARLGVGRLDVPSQAVPGVVSASQSLAATYSRLVKAEGVVDPVAARVGLTSGQVSAALSASPIPESPIVRIEATGASAAVAERLANLAGSVLTRFVAKLNSAGDQDLLIAEYRNAAGELTAAQIARDAAQEEEGRASSEEARLALAEATADYEVASLRLANLRERISQSAQEDPGADTITTLNTAAGAVSDEDEVLQRMVALGLLAGLAFGIVLALIRERAKRRGAAPA